MDQNALDTVAYLTDLILPESYKNTFRVSVYGAIRNIEVMLSYNLYDLNKRLDVANACMAREEFDLFRNQLNELLESLKTYR